MTPPPTYVSSLPWVDPFRNGGCGYRHSGGRWIHRPRDLLKGLIMGTMKNKKQDLKGKAKESEGKASGDKNKQAKGKADRVGASLKQAGKNVKDAIRK